MKYSGPVKRWVVYDAYTHEEFEGEPTPILIKACRFGRKAVAKKEPHPAGGWSWYWHDPSRDSTGGKWVRLRLEDIDHNWAS